MAVNIAAQQRLAQPATSFQRGQALRFAERQAEQDFALGEQQREINALNIERARNPQPDPAEIRAQDKARRERATELGSFAKDSATRSLSLYQQTLDATGSEEAARAAAQQQSDRDLQFATSVFGEELANQIDPDGQWTPEEAKAAIASVDDVMGEEVGKVTVFRDAKGNPVGTAREGTPQHEELLASGAFPGAEIGRPSQEATTGGGAGFATIQPKDYTAESVSAFQRTGDYSALVPRENPQDASARDERIGALVEMGVDPEMAVKIEDDLVRMEVVPQTGMVRMTDVVKGTATEIPVGVLGQEGSVVRAAPDPGRTLWDLSEFATGPISAGKAGASVISSMLGGPISERVAQARQTMEFETTNLIRSLSINPRFPVAEINRIREEVKLTPQIMDSPGLMRQRMISIDEGLKRRLAQAERDAADPSLPQQTRTDQASNASAIRNFLPILGVPEDTGPVEIETDEEYNDLPSGAQFIAPDGTLRTKP